MEYTILSNGVKMPMEGFGVFQVRDPKNAKRLFCRFCRLVTG